MHLATVECGTQRYAHGAVALELAQAGLLTGSLEERLRQELNAMASYEDVTFSARVVFHADGRATMLVQCMVPDDRRDRLTNLLASIGSLGCPGIEVVVPGTAAQLQTLVEHAPRHRCLVETPQYRTADVWLACPFRLSEALGWLHATACQLGRTLGYQINLYPFRPPVRLLREMLLNQHRMAGLGGMPAMLRQSQDGLVAKARQGRWLAEEFIMVGESEAPAVKREVVEFFRRSFAWFPAPGPDLEFRDGGFADELGLMCSFDERMAANASYVASHAIDMSEFTEMSWLPDALTHPQAGSASREPIGASGARSPVSHDHQPFVFISYARQDARHMRIIKNGLERQGLKAWVDERISGGDEWDSALEAHIRACALLLLVMSPRAVNSRYVRREVKFADILGKPVLCVKIEETVLTDGLAMLLLPIQWIDYRVDGARSRLAEAVASRLDAAANPRRRVLAGEADVQPSDG